MILRCIIQNFRCLRDVTVDLSLFTVLVGANATGKTAFLDAISTPHSYELTDVWQQQSSTELSIQIQLETGEHYKKIRHENGVSTHEGTPISCQRLHLDLGKMRMPNQVSNAGQLEQDGGNLTNVFATLTRNTQAQIAETLCRLVPMYADINHRPKDSGNHHLVFQDRWKPDLWHEPTSVSDGTFLLLAYLLLEHQSTVPDLIVIEEVERGLHPYLLAELVTTLRKLAQGELGSRAIQVVAATHSAELLNYLEPSEVRFIQRNPDDGSVTIEQAPTGPEWERAYDEYQNSLAASWLSGGLGGVPGMYQQAGTRRDDDGAAGADLAQYNRG